MRFLDWYYNVIGTADLRVIANAHSIEIGWIVEAGCHDGTDTLNLLQNFPNSKIITFEPDPISRSKAEERFGTIPKGQVELHPFGLSNEESIKFLSYVENLKGNGTTSISENGIDGVQTVTLDAFRSFPANGGLLWLDVEGHAVNALLGMVTTLRGIDLAKIEIQMHQKSIQRQQDYLEVIDIMAEAGLVPTHVPLQPGFFGDIYFVRKELLGTSSKIRANLLIFQMKLLHGLIYPLLGKPSQ